jgi:L-lactate dehydrogenase complex protein LldE
LDTQRLRVHDRVRVGLFVTCLVNLMRPRIGEAALRLLQASGAEIYVPTDQTCCGQPNFNAGDRDGARVLARKLLREFDNCDYIVMPSGSCAGTVRTHYPALFADGSEDEPLRALAARTRELTEFLVDIAGFDAPPGRFEGTVTYHDSCSGLRELGIKRQPRHLLERVPGVRLIEMTQAERCCGFGGAFAVKYGELSAHIADAKCDDIAATGADVIAAGDLGCLLNIEGRLRRRGDDRTRVLHIAELLAGPDPTWK